MGLLVVHITQIDLKMNSKLAPLAHIQTVICHGRNLRDHSSHSLYWADNHDDNETDMTLNNVMVSLQGLVVQIQCGLSSVGSIWRVPWKLVVYAVSQFLHMQFEKLIAQYNSIAKYSYMQACKPFLHI